MSKKLLAILKELATALDVPDEIKGKISDYKSDDDIEEGAITKAFKDAHRGKLDILSRNAAVELNKEKDAAYKAAERKVKNNMETLVKKKFGLEDSDADNVEALVDEAISKASIQGGKKGDITDDVVKTHPIYMALEKKAKQDLKKAETDAEEKVRSLTEEYQQKEIFNEIAADGLKLFKDMNPILSSDAAKAANQVKLVEEKLKGYKYQKVDGEIVIMNPDGTVVENELKEKAKLAEHVKNIVSPIFDFKAAEARTSPNGAGAGKPVGSNGDGVIINYNGALPKTKGELATMLLDSNVEISQRQELRKWADTNEASLAE